MNLCPIFVKAQVRFVSEDTGRRLQSLSESNPMRRVVPFENALRVCFFAVNFLKGDVIFGYLYAQ